MPQLPKNITFIFKLHYLPSIFLILSLPGCTADSLPSAEFDASRGHCYSMTPLLKTLPQSPILGNLIESERGCTIDSVWVSYTGTGSYGNPTFNISTYILDGDSPFARDFTLDGTAEISGPFFPKEAKSSSGDSRIRSHNNCLKHGVKLGQARPMRDFAVVTEEAGHLVCISTATLNGKLRTLLSIHPRADMMMEIVYSREFKKSKLDINGLAITMLPIVSELNLPSTSWPKPLGSPQFKDPR
ncbi:hypothetical protein [Marinobacter mangrovi]|uniref:hypothetical protein n=1 Tax=Marinobacter mangrovi TaxID=2803918 RepID=UPI0019327B4C|nr:hypothetical protein [Marinobacter mangrovi]